MMDDDCIALMLSLYPTLYSVFDLHTPIAGHCTVRRYHIRIILTILIGSKLLRYANDYDTVVYTMDTIHVLLAVYIPASMLSCL
jgi:hypothetical protein